MTVLYKDLKDKNVLVTGGASGLGYAIASAFVANYSNVVIVGRSSEKLNWAQKQLGEKVRCRAFDLNEFGRLPELVAEINEGMGAIDVLVNNAGINLKKDAVAVSDQEYQEIIQTNQTAVFTLAREIAKPMIAQAGGSIIMVSSMAAQLWLTQSDCLYRSEGRRRRHDARPGG